MSSYSKKFLTKVGGKYGAPMGRMTYKDDMSVKVHLFHVEMYDGCYDVGGAYWGSGQSIFCATDDDGKFLDFVRANNRKAAKRHFQEEYPDLKFYR